MYNYLHILFIVGLICMWKELRTQHEIDNFMKEIISQGIPAKRDNQPDATPKEDAPEVEKETRQAEVVQVTEQPQTEKTEKTGKEQPDQKPKTKKHDMEL